MCYTELLWMPQSLALHDRGGFPINYSGMMNVSVNTLDLIQKTVMYLIVIKCIPRITDSFT